MRMRDLSGTLVLAAGIVATGMLTPVTALAKVSLSLNTYVGGECVEGYKPDDDPITVKLLRADGSTRATRVDDSTSNEWSVCFRVAVMGSKVKASTLDGGNPVSRTVRIPVLTAVANRVSDVVSGQAPAGGLVTIVYSECRPSFCQASPARHATANSHGRYQKDLSSAPTSADIDGSDHVDIRYQNSHGDTFKTNTTAPYMEVQSPNRVFMTCPPRGTTTLKLRTSDGTLRASTSVTSVEDCPGLDLTFRKHGKIVTIHVGDRITGDFAADAALTWPSMSVTGQGNVLSGHCLKSAPFVVHLSNSFSTSYRAITDANGDFTADLTTLWTFASGDTLDLVCESSRGDRVLRRRTLP